MLSVKFSQECHFDADIVEGATVVSRTTLYVHIEVKTAQDKGRFCGNDFHPKWLGITLLSRVNEGGRV